jgi:hypothetical protein
MKPEKAEHSPAGSSASNIVSRPESAVSLMPVRSIEFYSWTYWDDHIYNPIEKGLR